MSTTDLINLDHLDDGFGHWLAGFIDGEGCFLIPRGSARSSQQVHWYGCRFELTLRGDDETILREIRSRTGLGHVAARTTATTENPAIRWAIGSKRDCAALVRLLDRYPLRAKKATDYAIWRQAVSAWCRLRSGSHTPPSAWGEMAALAAALRALRAYTDEAAVPAVAVAPPHRQLSLVRRAG